TLSGADTYAGATTVSAGSLLVSGSLTSAVALASGAVLAGTGSVGNVSSLGTQAGIVSPGPAADDGNPTVRHLLLGSGSLVLNIDGPTSYDRVKATGSIINLTNTNLTLAITPSAISGGDQYTIVSNPNNDPITGTFVGAAEGATIAVSGKIFSLSY